MYRPHIEIAQLVSWEIKRTWGRRRPHACVFGVLGYGMGLLGTGCTPQMSDAQGGSGGVGIRLPLPCLEGEQLGSVAGLQVMQAPVNLSLSG
jgi:hypothetical protein